MSHVEEDRCKHTYHYRIVVSDAIFYSQRITIYRGAES